jgi:NAD+ synthase (glutamine-hydrolysing)
MVIATVDLNTVRAYRSTSSRGLQAVSAPKYAKFHADFSLGRPETDFDADIVPSPVTPLIKYEDVAEIALAPACWLWGYLVKSRQSGFLIPLSGGLDSCSTSVLVRLRRLHA